MNPRRPIRDRSLSIILIGTDLSTGGGVNKVLRDLAGVFQRDLGADVTVVGARTNGPPSYAFPSDVRVEQHQRGSLLAYFRLLRALRRKQPDVVIGSWAQDNILLSLAFAFSRTKVLLVEHSPWRFHRASIRALRHLTYPLASGVIVLNRRDLTYYRRFLRCVRLIPNPVPPARTHPSHAREKLVLAVGHLEPIKQFDHAIRAMAASGLEKDGWSLTIIGSGSSEQSLRALIAELGLKRTEIRSGPEELTSWYAKASLLLLTSRMESFSLVLAEAMTAGVIPVAYASDGPEMILEDFPAQLVPLGDLPGLTERLERCANLTDSNELRRELAKSIEQRFSPNVIIRLWQELLRTSVRDHRVEDASR